MKKFIPWLVPITLLLAAVPVLLMFNTSVGAKIAGIVLVVVVSIAVRVWLYNASKLKKNQRQVRFTINERHTLRELYAPYDRISIRNRTLLEERMQLLLTELSFDKVDKSDVSREECLAFVLVAALLTQEMAYRSASDKIIVFSDATETTLHFQEKQPVLFVAVSDLQHLLRTVHQPDNADEKTESCKEVVLKLYQY